MPGGGWDGQVTEAELQELLRQKEKPVLSWQATLFSLILLGGGACLYAFLAVHHGHFFLMPHHF